MRLIERGWVLRNKIVWAKKNAMPASVDDPLNTKWEPLYFLVRSKRYYYDLDAVREPHQTTRHPRPYNNSAKYGGTRPAWSGPLAGKNDGLERARAEGRSGHPLGKNPGDFWTIGTTSYRGSHFAVFPKALAHKPIVAGCPERVCRGCGRPWQRERRRDRLGEMKPGCRSCHAGWRPGRVLDPFMGSGTVAVVAEDLGRDWLGIELNPAFVAMATSRVETARRQGGRR